LIVTYQSAPKGGLSVFYTVPSEELANPVPIPVNPVSGQDTIQRIKGLIDSEQNKFLSGGSPLKNTPGKCKTTNNILKI
jgi:hypothetical protein